MKLDNHPQSRSKENPMKRYANLAALATITTLTFANSAWAKVDLPANLAGKSNCEALATAPNQGVGKALAVKCAAQCKLTCGSDTDCAEDCLTNANGILGKLGVGDGNIVPPPTTDKWCASSQKRIPLADPCPPCPEGAKEVKGKCINGKTPPPEKVCGEHGAKPSCRCEGLWSGNKCQDAPDDCGLCGQVQKGEICNVWHAYTQSCVKPPLASQLACVAGTHEVKVNDKPACGCARAEALLIGFPRTSGDCPWSMWKKVGVGIVGFILLGLLIIVLYLVTKEVRNQSEKRKAMEKAKAEQKLLEQKTKAEADAKLVKCPTDDFMGIPGTHCGKCGKKLPDLPGAPPEIAKPEAPDAEKFVTRDELKATLTLFLANDVELRVLEESLKNYSTDIATEEQLLGNLKEATPPDEVEIKRVERRIENLKFRQGEAETILEQLRSDLKDRDKKLQ